MSLVLFHNIIIITQAASKYTRGADGSLTAHWEEAFSEERTWLTEIPNGHLSGDGRTIVRPQAPSVVMRRPAARPAPGEDEDEDEDEGEDHDEPIDGVPLSPKKRPAKTAASKDPKKRPAKVAASTDPAQKKPKKNPKLKKDSAVGATGADEADEPKGSAVGAKEGDEHAFEMAWREEAAKRLQRLEKEQEDSAVGARQGDDVEDSAVGAREGDEAKGSAVAETLMDEESQLQPPPPETALEAAQHPEDADVVDLNKLVASEFASVREKMLNVLPLEAHPPQDGNPMAKSYTLRKQDDDGALTISVIWSRSTFYVNPTVHLKNLPKSVPNRSKP